MDKRKTFIEDQGSRFVLNENVVTLLNKINKGIYDSSQKKKIVVYVCGGNGSSIAKISGTRRITLTPKQFLEGSEILKELDKMTSYDNDSKGFNNEEYKVLEIYIASEDIENIQWDGEIPEIKVQGNVLTLSGRISGEYGGVYRDSLQLEAHVVIPNGQDGFSELSECVITFGGTFGKLSNPNESAIANKVYKPMVEKVIKKHYDAMLAVSQELLNVLKTKNQIKVTMDYSPKNMRVGDFYDAYRYITHFIANVSVTNSNDVYKIMMTHFTIYKKVLRYHTLMTPHFEKINAKLSRLVNEERTIDDLTVLMDLSVDDLLNRAVENAISHAFDAKRTKSSLQNCLIPASLLLKRDRQSYIKMVGQFIKETSKKYPGSEIVISNNVVPGLIKVKDKDAEDAKEFQAIDPKFSYIGFSFEEVREDMIELPKKSDLHNVSQIITDFSLKPLVFRETNRPVKFHSQHNLKRYMAFKFANVVSEALGIDDASNCKIEIKVQVGEFLLRKLSPSSDKGLELASKNAINIKKLR